MAKMSYGLSQINEILCELRKSFWIKLNLFQRVIPIVEFLYRENAILKIDTCNHSMDKIMSFLGKSDQAIKDLIALFRIWLEGHKLFERLSEEFDFWFQGPWSVLRNRTATALVIYDRDDHIQ